MALLEVDDLRTYFFTREGAVKAVDGVSFNVEKGKTLGIVGESGCGKSVTALSIMGLIPKPPAKIVGGSVTFEGRDLRRSPSTQIEDVRGKEIAMIFQDPMTSLNPTFKIGTQITETMRRHFDSAKQAARQRAVELLEEVGIPRAAERLDDYPHQFSGGMRQRVMIAIALSCSPNLLIADEPTTALDVTIQAQILDLLERLREEHQMAMIIITHDMGVVAEVADDVAVMYAGQIVEQASVADLFDHPEHPYTEALLGALPQLEGEGIREGRLTAIPGRPPDLVDPPDGLPLRRTLPVRRAGRVRDASRRSCVRCGRDTGAHHAPDERARSGARDGDDVSESAAITPATAINDGSLLTVTDLTKHFPVRKGMLWEKTVGYVKAVDGVTFSIPEGKTLGLVGESGSGKSTTGYGILQLIRPTARLHVASRARS